MKALRWVLLACGLLALGAALWFTPALWARLDGWVQDQRDGLWARLEQAVGEKIVYRRIAPNVLAALDFQDVRVLADDGRTVFTAASVRVTWDWGLLFQGKFLEAFRKVQVINAVLDLDARKDARLLDRWTSGGSPSAGPSAFGFSVEAFNLSARWTDGTRSLALDRGFALLSPEEDHWSLRFRGNLRAEDRALGAWGRFAVRGDLRSDPLFENLSVRLGLSQVSTTWFDLEPVTVQVTLDPRSLTVAKVADQVPLDLQASWDRGSGQWRFQGAAEGFQPSRWVHWKANPLVEGLAKGTVTGRADYRLGGDFGFTGRVSWPVGALPAPLAGGPLSAEGAVGTSAGRIVLTEVHIQTPDVDVGFDGSFDPRAELPDGLLQVNRWTVAGAGEGRGTVQLTQTGNRVSFTGTGWSWNTLGTQAPEGWVERSGTTWTFRVAGPIDGSDLGQFAVEGTVDPGLPRFDGRVDLQGLPLEVLRNEVGRWVPDNGVPPEIWALTVGTQARVSFSPQGLELKPSTWEFRDPSQPGRSGQGAVSWRPGHAEASLDPLRWDGVEASAAVVLDFQDDGAVEGGLSGRIWDRSFALGGRWVPSDRTLAFSGAPGIAGTLHQDASGVWTLEAGLKPFEVLPGLTVGLTTRATLDGREWSAEFDQVEVTGRYPWNQEPFQARARVGLDPTFVRVDDLLLSDTHGRLGGSASSSWSPDFSLPWSGHLTLATPGTSRETLALQWVGTAIDRWKASFRVGGIDLGRGGLAALQGLQGRVAATGSADWAGTDGTWATQVSLSEARWGDTPVGLRASVSGTSRRVSVRNLNLAANPVTIADGSWDLDTEARTWGSAFDLGLRVGTADWKARWAVSGTWSPAGQPFRVSGRLSARGNSWSGRTFPDWGLAGFWSDQGWEASTDGGEVRVRGAGDGTFTVRTTAPFPVLADARGTWNQGNFDLDIQGFRADLALAAPFVNSPAFAVNAGDAEGALHLSGSPADPEVTGRLVLRGLSSSSSFVRGALGPVDVPVVFQGHEVRIDPVNVGPAGQTWMVSGLAKLDHLLPEEYQITVQTDPLSFIPGAFLGVGISASGAVSGQLVVRGTPLAVTVGGRLVLQDTLITLKDTGTPPPGDLGFNADLTLVTGRKVEFLWPNETLPLLRAVTATGQTLAIKANDVASTWSLTGKLALKTGEINYLNRTFVLKEGQLGFLENQGGFDPRLSVRAEYKVQETSGPVVINLRADGTLSKFAPRFDAVPYKSPEELQQLVGTTLSLPTDYTKAPNADAALSVASDIGTSFLMTPFEETVKKNFNLDLFTVRTEILKRTLLNRNGPLDAADYLDNTRLFFGKYIGDDLFLQGTLAFRQDQTAAAQGSPKMVVEPQFQLEFQTPFFLLDWDLLPQHPETLFVTDNTVTFRWNWSY